MVVPGIDTIDVSAVDTSLIGHSYYGSNDSVLRDMFCVLRESQPPSMRQWLRSVERNAMTFWVFQRSPEQAASRGTGQRQ